MKSGTVGTWVGVVVAIVAALPGFYGMFSNGNAKAPYVEIRNLVLNGIKPSPAKSPGENLLLTPAPSPPNAGVKTPSQPTSTDSSPSLKGVEMEVLSPETGLTMKVLNLAPQADRHDVLNGHVVLSSSGEARRPFIMSDQGWPKGWRVEGRSTGSCRVANVRYNPLLSPSELKAKEDEVPTLSKGQQIEIGFEADCARVAQQGDTFAITAVIYTLKPVSPTENKGVPITFQGTVPLD